jgi:hypothetical protein
MRMTAAVVVLCAATSTTLAECPSSPADLHGGITIMFDDGSVTQLHQGADGMIVEQTEYNSGSNSGFFARSKFGFVYVESADTSGGEVVGDSRMVYDYGLGGLDLVTTPDTETTRFTTERKISFADGTSRDERITFRTREYGERQWGACTYRVLPVEVSYFGSGDGRSQTFAYISDLGVAVYVGVTEWDTPVSVSEPVSVVRGLAPTE